jgi:hypothetical protein
MATTLSVLRAPLRPSETIGTRLAAGAGRVYTRVTQMLCAINGHERYRHLTADRVCLRCLLCGHETRGWTLSPPQQRRQAGGPVVRLRPSSPVHVAHSAAQARAAGRVTALGRAR